MPLHKNLAAGRWQKMPLSSQLANIGSEYMRWQAAGDDNRRQSSAERFFELIDLTLADRRWQGRLAELTRLREVCGDLYQGSGFYEIDPKILENYFLQFAVMSRGVKT